MYVTDGWGTVYKIDVRQNGKKVWKMDPDPDHDYAGNITCCGINNRGAVLYGDKVVSHTIDGRLIITNKESGEIEQDITIADLSIGESISAAPLVIKGGQVITGIAGGEYGIRGYINSTNIETGKQNWRTSIQFLLLESLDQKHGSKVLKTTVKTPGCMAGDLLG